MAASEGVDWAGTAHAVAHDARIACIVPSITETLFALGLGNSVVARTGFCIHPRGDVKRVPKIGGTKDPELARLRELQPTHLVVNVDENRREDVDAARAFVPNIIVTHPMDPGDNARLFTLLGAVFDRSKEARELIVDTAAALAELDAIARTHPRQTVLYLIWRKPWMTVSRDTYVSRTLARAGFDTVPQSSAVRYPKLGDDDPAWRDADRVLLSTEPYAFRERDAAELRARRAKPVDLIDGEWTSWYGVRAAYGARALANYRRPIAADQGEQASLGDK
ncbi:MAG TPA: helical backbone metal receptor [Casimicrobiaceae bacterium]|nr:helical backbone metal receptor [Casimicrobiaceae bacterium]